MLKRVILIFGFLLLFSVVSAYQNGYCNGVYNSNQYSSLTKTNCLDKQVQCPSNKPYVFFFNSYYPCRCITDPTYKTIDITSTSDICSDSIELNPTKAIETANFLPTSNMQGAQCQGIAYENGIPSRYLYTKFDLSNIDKSKIESVKYILDFCGGNVDKGLTANLYEYAGLTGSINWNNQLNPGNKLGSVQITGYDGIEFDVTNYVKYSGNEIDFVLVPSMAGSEYEDWGSLRGGYLEIKTTQQQNCVLGKVVECNDYVPEEEVPINYYRFQDNNCIITPLLKSQITLNDYVTLQECESKRVVEIVPIKPQPTTWEKIKNIILNFIQSFLDLFRQKTLTITGAQLVEPNTIETYQIDLSTTAPDKDYSDGTASWQWGNWALIDKNGDIKQQGQWEEINGRYVKSVTITTPPNIGDYALIGVITQKSAVYDYATKTWTYSDDQIITKEAIDIQSKYVVIEPEIPKPSPLQNLINAIRNWFCSKLGWFC